MSMTHPTPVERDLVEKNLAKAPSEAAANQEKPPVAIPAVDVLETPDTLYAIADLPGVTQEDLDIQLEKGRLTLRGKRTRGPAVGLVYERTFVIPQSVDTERVTAAFEMGVLTLTLPKVSAAQPRRIPIRG